MLHITDLRTNSHPFPASRSPTNITEGGYAWLESQKLLFQQTLDPGEWISWTAYYASITETPATPSTKSYVLPLSMSHLTAP